MQRGRPAWPSSRRSRASSAWARRAGGRFTRPLPTPAPPGWRALHATADHARAAGLLVLADAKRGDIDISAQRYAEAFLAPGGLEADALTVSPYLGADSLQPFVETARAAGAGLFVLVRTSNRGAADIQDLELAVGGRVWEQAARLVDWLGSAGDASGLDDV